MWDETLEARIRFILLNVVYYQALDERQLTADNLKSSAVIKLYSNFLIYTKINLPIILVILIYACSLAFLHDIPIFHPDIDMW